MCIRDRYKAAEAAAAKDPVLKRISKLTIANRERISSTRNLRLPRYDFDTSKLVLFRLPKRQGLSKVNGSRILIRITRNNGKSRPYYKVQTKYGYLKGY